MKFRGVIKHFKGVPGSPNPVSNANFTSIRAQGAILNSKKFLSGYWYKFMAHANDA